MENDMNHKFTRTDEVKADFEREKVRMEATKKFLNVYKNGLAK